jgi:L-fuculose-phosphate aldolase
VHDDAVLSLYSSGAPLEFKVLSLDPPFVLGKPVHFVPAHVDVEADVSTVASFVANTNSVVLVGHGLTTFGRNISEAYHRLNTLTAEVRRILAAEQHAKVAGTRPAYRSQAEIEEMYRFAERIIYPTRADNVMHEEAAE